ncbi:MAG: hypothetical protein ACLQGJ_05695 [Candidatus Dormibacteria bacterium]
MGSVRQRGQVQRCVGLAGLVGLLAACGPAPIHGSSGSNGGEIAISQAATYSYSVTVSQGLPPVTTLSILRLSSDTGSADVLSPASGSANVVSGAASWSGSVYLSAGNWTGQAGWTPGLYYATDPFPGCVTDPREGTGYWFCPETYLSWSLTLMST